MNAKTPPLLGVTLGNCPSFCAKTFGVQNSPFWPVFLQFNLSRVPHVIPSLCPFQGLATVLDNLASVWTVALTSQAREESRPGKGGRVELLPPPFFFFSSILNNFLQENLGAHISAPVHRASTPCLCILCAETQPGRPGNVLHGNGPCYTTQPPVPLKFFTPPVPAQR